MKAPSSTRLARLGMGILLLWNVAHAETDPLKVTFKIEAQPLGDALNAFAAQSGYQLLFPSKIGKEIIASPVHGLLAPEQALQKLLAESGLHYEFINPHTVAIRSAVSPDGVQPLGAAEQYAPLRRLAQVSGAAEEEEQGSTAEGAAKQLDSSGGRESEKLEEIVVTAQKREQRLQDIPLSVSVLDEQLLLKTGAVDFVDYATRIPNLSFGAFGAPLSQFTTQIRGVSGGATGGTTSFYIDDVPLPERMNPKVMDISRIEVLRGPQGSLYGARSMGGTVRLITKRADPTATEFKTHASLGAVAEGDFDYAVDAAVNVPIASNLAFRGNVYYLSQTGVHDIVVDNPTVAGDEVTHENADDGEYWGLQAMATWNPTERLTVEPRFMYQNSHLDWVPYSDLRPDNFTAKRVIDRADPNDEEWSISSLTVNWDTDWGRFTSATAFLNAVGHAREEFSEFINVLTSIPISVGGLGADPNGTPDYYPPGGAMFEGRDEYRQITEEARFTSQFDGRLQLTTGVFYSKIKTDTFVPCSLAVGIGEATGNPLPECIFSADGQSETEEAAVFGELEYTILDNLFLTLGGRYFDNTFTTSQLPGGLFAPFLDRRSVEQSESGFNPKIALKWAVMSDWTLYSSAAQGYRIGGANLGVPDVACGDDLAAIGLSAAPDTYKSDSLWSYEIGSKSRHAGGRFTLSAAAFYIDWKDIIQETRLACGFAFTNNTGTAESKGVEVEISGQPIDRLTYSLGVGYTDAKITDPEDAAGVLAGDPLPQVPQWNFSGNTEYRFPIGTHEGYFFGSYSWVDSSISVNTGRGNPRVRDAYGLLDVRLGMTVGQWDISLSGKNLTDEHANLADSPSLAAETPGRPRFITNRPRTIGVDVRWVF